jgi:hypothetical protein
MKYSTYSVAILIALSLSGCGAFSSTKPNNRPSQEVNCSGFADWQACDAKAARLCEGGYDTIGKEENLVTQKRVMRFSCKS